MSEQTVSRDLEHLKLLSIFEYIWAGLIFCGSCVPLVYIGLGVAFLTGMIEENDPGASIAGGFILVFGIFLVLLLLTLGFLFLRVARCLKEHRSRTYCIVMAAIQCLSIPFGTILGVFTIMVLSRESVKTMFEERESG